MHFTHVLMSGAWFGPSGLSSAGTTTGIDVGIEIRAFPSTGSEANRERNTDLAGGFGSAAASSVRA